MTVFHLPDLGEGLPDAEIQQWHVNVGDQVEVGQVLASVETAKAVVDIPAPFSGLISQLHGQAGEVIPTGQPLVTFDAEPSAEKAATVAGTLKVGQSILEESPTGLTPSQAPHPQIKATPAVRALARQQGIQLSDIQSINAGIITREDVLQHSKTPAFKTELGDTPITLHGTHRRMAQTLTEARRVVVPVTLFEDADIAHWNANSDASVKIIRAIQAACQQEPTLNSWFDGQQLVQKAEVRLGLALDTPQGLFVPVLRDLNAHTDEALRTQIDALKTTVHEHHDPELFQGATLTLSNFGSLCGRYATPMIVPPQVAILGVGRMRIMPVVIEGEVLAHPLLPLSLTFDHRALTGGQAARFLKALIEAL